MAIVQCAPNSDRRIGFGFIADAARLVADHAVPVNRPFTASGSGVHYPSCRSFAGSDRIFRSHDARAGLFDITATA